MTPRNVETAIADDFKLVSPFKQALVEESLKNKYKSLVQTTKTTSHKSSTLQVELGLSPQSSRPATQVRRGEITSPPLGDLIGMKGDHLLGPKDRPKLEHQKVKRSIRFGKLSSWVHLECPGGLLFSPLGPGPNHSVDEIQPPFMSDDSPVNTNTRCGFMVPCSERICKHPQYDHTGLTIIFPFKHHPAKRKVILKIGPFSA